MNPSVPNTEHKELFSLGSLYVSDFLKPDEEPRHPPVEMKLVLDENGTAMLEKTPPPESMWGKYWYRSSISGIMKKQLRDVVSGTMSLLKIDEDYRVGGGLPLWVDIAGNDGYMLSQVSDYFIKVNIDPAEESFVSESEKHADLVIQDYFSASVYKNSSLGMVKASVVSCISMFYDLTEPGKFLDDVHEILEDNGLFVLQMSYTPLMIQQMEFGNICHEHKYYYSLFNIKKLLEKHNFKIMDCSLNDTNGGSFRIYAMKQGADITKFASSPHRDVCNFRIASLLDYEKTLKMDQVETWTAFYDKINELGDKIIKFITKARNDGLVVGAYGASTKGNTLLQYFGLDNALIDFIAERSEYKFGLRTVGTNIPIISEEEMRLRKPDYLLVLPWHFINEFIEREKEFLEGGGCFIVPCPEFKIIGREDI